MKTEQEIVYELLNIVHGGNVSNDDVISERLVRSFLRKHRASKLVPYMNRGWSVEDYVFQSLGLLEFNLDGTDYSRILPAIIHFDNTEGIKITKSTFNIPVLNEESFELSKSNMINGTSPKACFKGQKLYVYAGNKDYCKYLEKSSKESVIESFTEEIEEVDDNPKIYVNVSAVLYDPEEATGYNWKNDAYPCPSEIIDQLTTSTLARDLDLMIRQQSDKVPNNKTGLDPDYDRSTGLQ